MTYIVIAQNGTLTPHDTSPTVELIEAAVGPEGWDRVRLGHDMAGWVNDCGLVMPGKYERNPVGAGVLAALGAGMQPYAGPVVITGWNPYADGSEIAPLDSVSVLTLNIVHDSVQRALSGRKGFGEPWDSRMREFAEHVRTGPVPGWTVLHDDEAMAYLQRQATSDGAR